MNFYKQLFFSPRFYQVGGIIMAGYIMSYFIPSSIGLIHLFFFLYLFLCFTDLFYLFSIKNEIEIERKCAERFSNGDENQIEIKLRNNSQRDVHIEIIDEIPIQFQLRNLSFTLPLKRNQKESISYTLRPTERGEYFFGNTILFLTSKLGLIRRKYVKDNTQTIKVYPSYLQLKKFELMAFHTAHLEGGIKKIRKIGQQKEFDQIKEYVAGDDFRTINWSATARSQNLMVNHYQDEKAQQVYTILDMGRSMQMPFNGLTLLDYAINTSLVFLHIAIKKQDRVGMTAFDHEQKIFVKSQHQANQLKQISEHLYNLKPSFLESDLNGISSILRKKVNQRSLLMLFTNFQHRESLERKLSTLKQLAKRHLLVVILFEDEEIKKKVTQPSQDIEDIYNKTLLEETLLEKRFMLRLLQKNGIHAVLSSPQELSVNTINKYLELKSRGLI